MEQLLDLRFVNSPEDMTTNADRLVVPLKKINPFQIESFLDFSEASSGIEYSLSFENIEGSECFCLDKRSRN